jgi:hypothetical protein
MVAHHTMQYVNPAIQTTLIKKETGTYSLHMINLKKKGILASHRMLPASGRV